MMEFPGLVDSHLHLLSMEQKGLNPAVCLEEFFRAGGRWGLDVAVDCQNWEKRLAWGDGESRLWFTAGFHPSVASAYKATDWDALEVQTQHARCLALGEIGLDWFRGRENEVSQRRLFREQLELAGVRRLPIIVHNRQADRELLEDLDSVSWSGTGIQHCFSSDKAFAKAALDRGFLLSFAGNVTYPSAGNLREVAAWAPLDRVLVETDSPYLSPVPVRNQPNQPRNAGVTAKFLADLRGLSLEEVLQTTGDNFARLMGLS